MNEQSAPPALSTPDTHIFERQPAVKPENAQFQLSDAQHYVTYEIERTIVEIQEHRYKRVALQFPDSMLRDAPRVFRALETELNQTEPKAIAEINQTGIAQDQQTFQADPSDVTLFILGDTSYGACCVDEVAAEHADADVVIHYGRSCLSPTSRIPALYVFTQQPLDEQRLLGHFKSFYEDLEQKIILMADVTYQQHLPSLRKELEGHGFRNLFLAKVLHDPSSPLPNRTIPPEVEVDPRKLEEWQLFHISDPPEALLLILSSRIGDVQIYSSSYTSGNSYNIVEPSANRALNRRYALLTSVSTVPIFGILINTLSVKNYLHVVEHVKSQILIAGKKSYTFVVGKVNAAKIANFSEIGAWVVVGCWESSLIDGKDFWKPVITPFELELALKNDDERVWTGEWSSDFQKVLEESKERKKAEGKDRTINSNGAFTRDGTFTEDGAFTTEGLLTKDGAVDGSELDSEPESIPPDFDLRSGRYVSRSRPMRTRDENAEKDRSSSDPSIKTLARRAKRDIVTVGGEASPGAEFLQSRRTWKGLGSDFEIAYEEDGGAIEQGRSGIARGYTQGERGGRT